MEYPDFDSRLLTIFEQMLQFNPGFRFPAAELLKSSLFDSIRDPKMEAEPTFQVKTSVDGDGEFDYDELQSTKFSSDDFLGILMKE
mmetsp:Transcript_29501/g.44839  ORF Transcript_29501/g.44839 Transcript_29501/m.44839 type:complete len:86 (+) Transcript_29501:1053-1310(+)|eukprot:CAMPEP_0170496220 /NCGR_PEP_ID=MMETSP0208-20121228/20761_1 /TAXON_ID=197538 /ORGANISM="Strombidium inclinatum, Strain S3" /LENGTH=85 /DNA_ID=CAMNT_0010772699 /DNA_START=962 /DNA_END=1219 /DNA_ORIENTATION=-